MNFIQLTHIEGHPVRFNFDLVASYHRRNDYTVIILGTTRSHVQETPGEIDDLIGLVKYSPKK